MVTTTGALVTAVCRAVNRNCRAASYGRSTSPSAVGLVAPDRRHRRHSGHRSRSQRRLPWARRPGRTGRRGPMAAHLRRRLRPASTRWQRALTDLTRRAVIATLRRTRRRRPRPPPPEPPGTNASGRPVTGGRRAGAVPASPGPGKTRVPSGFPRPSRRNQSFGHWSCVPLCCPRRHLQIAFLMFFRIWNTKYLGWSVISFFYQ